MIENVNVNTEVDKVDNNLVVNDENNISKIKNDNQTVEEFDFGMFDTQTVKKKSDPFRNYSPEDSLKANIENKKISADDIEILNI